MTRPARLLALLVGMALPLGLTAPVDAGAPERRLHTAVSFPTRTVKDAAGNTRLADRHGRPMQLHGANLGKIRDVTEQTIADMAAAGMTLLRLPIQWEHLEPTQGAYDAAYVEEVQQALDWADEYGLLVLVDWHQDVYGPAFPGFDGAPAWTTRTDGLPYNPDPNNWFNNYFQPAVQRAFYHLWHDADLQQAQVAAWTHLADELKGSPALLGYDLFNEPPDAVADTAAMYRRLIAGIRSVDQRSWLWVEPSVMVGMGLPTLLPGFTDPRPGPDRIGYAPHAYVTEVEEGGDWDTESAFVEAYEDAITAYPRRHHMPVIVGEWGPGTAGPKYPGNVALVRRQAASFPRFASGWAIWYACQSTDGSGYCIFSDEAGHLGRGRAAAWRPYPLVLAGTAVSESATLHRYRLTYRVRPGRLGSQIVVPSGFGRRVSVTLLAGRKRPKGIRTTVSAPSRTGARTVTISGRVRQRQTWTVTIQGR